MPPIERQFFVKCRVVTHNKHLQLIMCYVYVHVKLAPPTYLGAWSMAGLLGQPLEYYIICSVANIMILRCPVYM